MKMKEPRTLLVHPDQDANAVRTLCRDLPDLVAAADPGAVVYRGRNLLIRVSFAGRDWVAKCFRLKNPLKRLLYRCRTPKAIRSYEVAIRLGDLGFGTPAPLAAVTYPTGSPLHACYLSAHLDGWLQVRDLHVPTTPRRLERIAHLGAWLGRLHDAGVLHRDGTVGNILFDPTAAEPDWHLVDLNRVRFGRVSSTAGVHNLVKLEQRDAMGEALLGAYCAARGLDPQCYRRRYHRWLCRHLLLFELKNRTRRWRRALNPFRE